MNEKKVEFTQMEQDLILACKGRYDENHMLGIKKVIGNYCDYDYENVEESSIYHFISELYVKLLDNNHLSFRSFLLNAHYDFEEEPLLYSMIREIMLMRVIRIDGVVLIELNHKNDDFYINKEMEKRK